jgi:hypothetical protein
MRPSVTGVPGCSERADTRRAWARLCLDVLRPYLSGIFRAYFCVAMRLARLAAVSTVMIMAGGCTAAPLVGYRNGAVTLCIGDVRHVCAAGGSSN